MDCPQMKTVFHSSNQNTIRIWYFLRLIHMAGIALWYTVKLCLAKLTNKFFSSSSFSCLPVKVCKAEVNVINILFSLGIFITHGLFWSNLSLDMLVVTNLFPIFLEVKIQFSHILINWKKGFKIYQLHKK